MSPPAAAPANPIKHDMETLIYKIDRGARAVLALAVNQGGTPIPIDPMAVFYIGETLVDLTTALRVEFEEVQRLEGIS